jgi:hypothetical protein
MNIRRRHLLVCLLLLGMIPALKAEEPLGVGAFGGDAPPPPAPEFCPPPHKEQRTSTTPFDNLCPVGNAFSTLCPPETNQPGWYLGLGGMALRPVGMSTETVATVSSTGETIGFQNVPTQYAFGIRGNVGIIFGTNAVEISGYYLIPQSNLTASVTAGDIDVRFGNFPPPPGFSGSGGSGSIWLGADRLEIARTWEVGNLEANYRHCFLKGIELLAGFRYFDYRDRLSIFTDQHAITGTSPVTQATYSVNAHNRIIAPQLGFECEKSLVSVVSVGVTGKAAVGPNFFNAEQTLTRGDGLQGPSGANNETVVSGVFDLAFYMHFWFNDNFRVRLGYDLLWLVNAPEAQSVINFNPNTAGGDYNRNGGQVFHGPQFEFEVAF